MKSESEVKKELINDLKKTGFVSEMLAMKTFVARKWRTSGSRGYFDLDENKTCEIDLYAYHTLLEYKSGTKDVSAHSFFSIVAEVKKTQRPWIIFRENPQNNWRLQEGWSGLIYLDGVSQSKSTKPLTDVLLTSGWGYNLGWFGYGIHEAFKFPEQGSQWYKALVKSCKAGEDVLKANSGGTHSYPYLFFVKPAIILDGELMSAHLDENANIEIETIKAAMVDFDFSTQNYNKNNKTRYAVDVISLKYLDQYLEFSEERHRKIFNELNILA